MNRKHPKVASDQTRDRLLEAATRQFAERGFHGVSIADIASELSMSKQALLYHFDRKEALYAAVIEQITKWMLQFVPSAPREGYSPALQLEHTFLRLFRVAMENPVQMRLLMREILDNSSRAHIVHNWPVRDYFDALVALIKLNPGLEKTAIRLSSHSYFRCLELPCAFRFPDPR